MYFTVFYCMFYNNYYLEMFVFDEGSPTISLDPRYTTYCYRSSLVARAIILIMISMLPVIPLTPSVMPVGQLVSTIAPDSGVTTYICYCLCTSGKIVNGGFLLLVT